MAKFAYDDDGDLVADEAGDLTYEEALNGAVEHAVASFEGILWDLVDAVEFLATEETLEPEDVIDKADDEGEV